MNTVPHPRRVNVMQVISGLGIGGAEIVVRDLARHVDNEAFHVSICCLKTLGPIGRELEAEGIDICTLPGADADRADYFTALKLRRLMRDRAVDIAHSHTTHALLDAGLCRSVMPGVRVVHTFHFGNYPHKPTGELWMERLGCRLVDRLVAVGEVQRDQVIAAHRLSKEAIGVVRNGVQLPLSAVGDPEFRARIGAEAKILVGVLATLIPQKGLPDLLYAARRVRDVRDDVHFVIVGEGVLRPELERLRAQLGLDHAVTLTGWLTNAASLALPVFDIYVQASHWEAMSISILEAMAAGKPVIATRVGEASRLIADGDDGVLVDAGDVSEIAQAILTLAGDAGRRQAIGTAAARTVAGRYTVSHMARAYEDVYRTMLTPVPEVTPDAIH